MAMPDRGVSIGFIMKLSWQESKLKDKDDEQEVKQRMNLFGLSGSKLCDRVENQSCSNTIGDAVGECHDSQSKECGQ